MNIFKALIGYSDIVARFRVGIIITTGMVYSGFALSATPANDWAVYYNGLSNGADSAVKVVHDSVGNVYVAGSSVEGLNLDITTIKYDASGTLVWKVSYDGGLDDAAADLAIDESGNVYVTGTRIIDNNEGEFVTLKYDSSGSQLWVKHYHDTNFDAAAALAIDGSGNVYVTGSSEDHYYNQDYTTVKYDSAGIQLWVAKYDDGPQEAAVALAVDNGGNIYITGSSQDKYTTIKYDAFGVQLWVSVYANGYTDQSVDLVLDNVGGLYVTGYSSNGVADDYATP